MTDTTNQTNKQPAFKRRDLHEQITDSIIQQLEKGVVPWLQPWKNGVNDLPGLPSNFTTGKHYRGINILLLWASTYDKQLTTDEWASFKQWQARNEQVRKGEKGTMIVYYDTFKKEVDDEIKEIPYIKSSVVFNRCQLASYTPEEPPKRSIEVLAENIDKADLFIANTKAAIRHHAGGAYYSSRDDNIYMPYREFFIRTENCTATEGYYSVLAHELTHWTGGMDRLDRINHKKFGDKNYANEELLAELGGAFLCAEFGITVAEKGNTASYIDHWLKVLKEDKQCIVTAASGASKAIDYLHELQPKPDIN